jgi:phosphotransferase system enzyme I (PtsI)
MVLHSDFKKLEHEISKILRNEDPDKSELLLNKLNQITV